MPDKKALIDDTGLIEGTFKMLRDMGNGTFAEMGWRQGNGFTTESWVPYADQGTV